jgi:hypothetical protein
MLKYCVSLALAALDFPLELLEQIYGDQTTISECADKGELRLLELLDGSQQRTRILKRHVRFPLFAHGLYSLRRLVRLHHNLPLMKLEQALASLTDTPTSAALSGKEAR